MENFGIGWILNLGGPILGYVEAIISGAIIGVAGYYWQNKIRGAKSVNSKFSQIIIFSVTLWLYWFLIMGFEFYHDTRMKDWWMSSFMVAVWCMLIPDLFFGKDVKLLRGNIIKSSLWLTLVSVLMFIIWLSINHVEISTIRMDKHQKLDYRINDRNPSLASTSPDKIKNLKEEIEEKELKVKPLVWAFINLRIGNYAEAGKYFEIYSAKKPVKQRLFWEGVALYYQGKFQKAYQKFFEADDYDFALLSLYKSGGITVENFSRLNKKQEWLTAPAREVIKAASKIPMEEMTIPKDKSDKILSLLQELVRNQRKENAPVAELDAESFRHIGQVGANEFKFYQPKESVNIFIFLITWFSVSLASMSGAIAMMKKSNINHWLSHLISSMINWPLQFFKSHSFQSFIARKISAKLAIMEKEKGFYTNEINNINRSVFPFDILMSLFYYWRAKKTIKYWELETLEKVEINYIHESINILSGKLIPQGNAEILAIITALRKKSEMIRNKFIKEKISYAKARVSLLETLSELSTVGDVLGARSERDLLDYYKLLGIDLKADDETVKKAYRSILMVIHPDKNQENYYLHSLAALIIEAHATLNDKFKRHAYNLTRGF